MTSYKKRMQKNFISVIVITLLAQYYLHWIFVNHLRNVSINQSSVAVVDRQKVLKGLTAVMKIREALNEHLRQCQKDFIVQEAALRKEYQEILGAEAAPNNYEQALAIEEKRKSFKNSTLTAQKEADKERQKIQDAYDTAMKKINQKFVDVLDRIVREQQVECVLDRVHVVHCSRERDLTHLVSEMLEQATRTVVLEI